MGSKSGYEYNYRFSMGKEMIIPDRVLLLFELRTNFILKIRRPIGIDDREVDNGSIDDNMMIIMMGSESHTFPIRGDIQCKGNVEFLDASATDRLKEYRVIPDDVIPRLVDEAFDFAREKGVDPQNASKSCVVVSIDVCTVQQEGELLDAAMDRAIRPGRLTRSSRWITGQHINEELWCFLKNILTRVRVKNVDEGLSLMDVCPICLNSPTIDTPISLLPSCGHAFHFHCVVSWLVKSNSCPLCRQRAHDIPISDTEYSSSDSSSDSDSDSDFVDSDSDFVDSDFDSGSSL